MSIHNDEIYKTELLDLYRRVADVLRSRNIEFYAAYGTCLGAVRHRGIIPWDDDVDIAVWRKDLQPALLALNTAGVGVVAGGGETSSVYPSHYGRVFNRVGATSSLERKHVYIDLFTIDYADNSKLIYRVRSLCCVGINRIIAKREGIDIDSKLVHVFSDVVVFPLRMLKTERLMRLLDCIYNPRRVTKYVKMPGDCHSRRYPISCYSGIEEMDFNGEKMPVPVGYDQILTIRYGDWRTPPPKDQRVGNAYAQDGKSWNVKVPKDSDRSM